MILNEEVMKNIYEVLEEFSAAETEAEKIKSLQENGSHALLCVLRGMFSPNIEYVIEDIPPYNPSDAPPGMGYTSLAVEINRMYLFEANNPKVAPNLSLERKKQLLIQILENLEAKEAEVVISLLKKKSPVKGLTKSIVEKAFPQLL